jgi:hypothetical protein
MKLNDMYQALFLMKTYIAHLNNLTSPSIMENEFGSKTAYKRAERDNLVVAVPTPRQLFVDIDNEIDYGIFQARYERLIHFYSVEELIELPSKSGLPNRHITVTLREPVDNKERLILQLFLGSDPIREFLGLQRIKVDDPVPTLFLERKPEQMSVEGDSDIPF